jgi:hypothetical protein
MPSHAHCCTRSDRARRNSHHLCACVGSPFPTTHCLMSSVQSASRRQPRAPLPAVQPVLILCAPSLSAAKAASACQAAVVAQRACLVQACAVLAGLPLGRTTPRPYTDRCEALPRHAVEALRPCERSTARPRIIARRHRSLALRMADTPSCQCRRDMPESLRSHLILAYHTLL